MKTTISDIPVLSKAGTDSIIYKNTCNETHRTKINDNEYDITYGGLQVVGKADGKMYGKIYVDEDNPHANLLAILLNDRGSKLYLKSGAEVIPSDESIIMYNDFLKLFSLTRNSNKRYIGETFINRMIPNISGAIDNSSRNYSNNASNNIQQRNNAVVGALFGVVFLVLVMAQLRII